MVRTVVIMGCGFVTMGVQSDCFIVLSKKNPRIANTVVYIIACYVIYYIILVYGSHKKKLTAKIHSYWIISKQAAGEHLKQQYIAMKHELS